MRIMSARIRIDWTLTLAVLLCKETTDVLATYEAAIGMGIN